MTAAVSTSHSTQKLAIFPSLKGKRIFITGGGTGIGAAIVTAFAEQGAQVAFVDVAEADSAQLATTIAPFLIWLSALRALSQTSASSPHVE